MFDVGFNELVLIFIIGLLVLGPQRLPKVAAEIGKWIGRARRTAAELRRQLEREIELNDIQPPPSSPPPTETQNPFHHAPLDTGATPSAADAATPPAADAASPASTAPPATTAAPPPAAPTPETATPSATAKAPEPVSEPAPEAAKASEPTDRSPHP